MATKRIGIPKAKPALHFEQVPLAAVKAVIVPSGKPEIRPVARRRVAGR
jgi:hypothetical protein